MKDYSLGKKKNFILNYKVKNDLIIINLANKNTRIIPYSKDKEITILKLMKSQINNNFERNIKKQINYSTKLSAVFLGLIALVGSFILLTNLPFNIGAIIYSYFAINTGIFIKNSFDIIKYKSLLKDLNKNKLFIENEIIFNESKSYDNKKRVTINDVNKISYNRLNNLIKYKKRVLKK